MTDFISRPPVTDQETADAVHDIFAALAGPNVEDPEAFADELILLSNLGEQSDDMHPVDVLADLAISARMFEAFQEAKKRAASRPSS